MQIGLDPPERVVLADDAATSTLLGWLRAGRRTPGHADADLLLTGLLSGGLVLDADEVRRVADERGRRRRPHVVAVSVPARLDQEVGRMCAGSGVGTRGPGFPTATLLVTTGEPLRAAVDALARDDLPHLLVALHPDRVRIGPFVVPGRTACLRCLDAHAADRDPHRGAVLMRLEAERAQDALPASYDPALASLALAWAVRDLTRFLDGEKPATWSTTVVVGVDLGVEHRRWLRHPGCGCAWGDALTA